MRGVTVPSRARENVAVRLSAAERRLLEAASAARPEHLSTYIRESALEVARRDLTLAEAGQRAGA